MAKLFLDVFGVFLGAGPSMVLFQFLFSMYFFFNCLCNGLTKAPLGEYIYIYIFT